MRFCSSRRSRKRSNCGAALILVAMIGMRRARATSQERTAFATDPLTVNSPPKDSPPNDWPLTDSPPTNSATSHPATTQPASSTEPSTGGLFTDAQDNALDISNFLSTRVGFLPLVMPITEPAVGFGFTL